MKRVIRNSTFETNSSSMHSLVISQENMPISERTPIYSSSTITARFGDYGGEFSVKLSLQEKLNYFYTAMILCIADETDLKRFYSRKRILRQLFRERNILLDFQSFSLIRDPDSYYTSYEAIPNDRSYFGSEDEEVSSDININHYGELIETLETVFNTEDLLEKLLFNEDSFIVTGSDSDDKIWEEIFPPLKYPVRVFVKGN